MSLFSAEIPSYSFSSVDEAVTNLSKHSVYTEQFSTSHIKVEDGLLHLGGSSFVMSDAFAPRLMKLLKLPNKNLEVLDIEHLTADINYRAAMLVEEDELNDVGVRFFDGAAYDIYPVKRDNLVLPIKHSIFLQTVFNSVTDIASDAVFPLMFDHVNGLRFKTKATGRSVNHYTGAKIEIGLAFQNVDYNKGKYGSNVSFHLFNPNTGLSITGVDFREIKIKKEGAKYLDILCTEANFLMQFNLQYLYKAIENVMNTELTEYVFESVRSNLNSAVGKKDAENLLLKYLENDDKNFMEKIFSKDMAEGVTEYEFIQDVVETAQEICLAKMEKIERAIAFPFNYQLHVVKESVDGDESSTK